MVQWDRYWLIDDHYFFADLGGARTLRWLCEYVASDAAAQRGLDDPARVTALVHALERGRIWGDRPMPSDPLFGPHLDLHVAVTRAVLPRTRLLGGRLVASDPEPPKDELVGRVRELLPKETPPKWSSDAAIGQEIARYLDRRPWPFDVLGSEETSSG